MYKIDEATKTRATEYFNALMSEEDMSAAEGKYGIAPQQFFAYKRGSMVPGLRIMYGLQRDSCLSLDIIDARINEGVKAALELEKICDDETSVMPIYIQRVTVRRILNDINGYTNMRPVYLPEIIAFADRYERSKEKNVVSISKLREGVNRRIWSWVDINFGFTFANSLQEIGGNAWQFSTESYRCVVRLMATGRIAFQSFFRKDGGECESVCREFELQ